MAASYCIQRALFVVGEPNSGKSNQLRSIFRDVRLGTDGNVPGRENVPETYRLSNERGLYLRLTSPHEMGEFLDGRSARSNKGLNFLDKTERKISRNTPRVGRRWNFAGALQPEAFKNMPDAFTTCKAFLRRFNPERIRLAFLSPDRRGAHLQSVQIALVDQLQTIPSIEICWIDARDRTANGLFLADFILES